MARDRKEKRRTSRESVRDKARAAADKRERGGGGLDTLQNLPRDIEFWKPKMGKGNKGKNRFSIVPYLVSIDTHPFQTAGEPWHECTYWQHKIGVGADSKRFICPAKTAQSENKKCPICEYRAALLKSGQDPELAEELKPKQRQLFNILDHDDENKGIQLFEISPHMFGFMLDDEDKAQAEDFGDRYYGDFENGLAILARFAEGNFAGNKFPECVRIDFEERDDLPEEMITDEAVDLDAALKILGYKELNDKFFELDAGGGHEESDGDQDGDEEEEKPKSRNSSKSAAKTSSSRARKKKEEDDDDDDDQDDDDDDQDGEPEEKPAGRTRQRNKKPEPEPKARSRKEKGDNPCPAGLRFGNDCDTDDACDKCDVWDDCRDRLDEIEAEGKKRRKGKKDDSEDDIPF